MKKRPASVKMSSAAMNCQRAKSPVQVFVMSVQGWAGWQRIAIRKIDTIAHTIDVEIVPQIANAWPRPGVKRRKRNAVAHLERNMATI
jgi:hypothetical protein